MKATIKTATRLAAIIAFATVAEARQQGERDGSARTEQKCDKDGDRQGQHKVSPEHREKMLERFDRDGDGELSQKERHAAREAFKKHHRKNGNGNDDTE